MYSNILNVDFVFLNTSFFQKPTLKYVTELRQNYLSVGWI